MVTRSGLLFAPGTLLLMIDLSAPVKEWKWVNNVRNTSDKGAVLITPDPSGNVCAPGFLKAPALLIKIFKKTWEK